MNSPSSRSERVLDGDTTPRGRAEARRTASAALAELADRQAQAVAALDRALEARLRELDAAIATRRMRVEARLKEAESDWAEAVATGVAEYKRSASDERRLLQEETAARVAQFDRAVQQHLREIAEMASAELTAMRQLLDRMRELNDTAEARLRELDDRLA